jgi:hypothetical protein
VTFCVDAASAREVTGVGWDALETWLLVRESLDVGQRSRPLTPTEVSVVRPLIESVRSAVAYWPSGELPEPRPATMPSDWPSFHPLGLGFGVAPDLVAIAERLHPDGEWRCGTYPDQHFPGPLLARVKAGELVAVLAPCDRCEFADEALNPGSDLARENGCHCPVLDNGHGSESLARDRGGWIIFSDCPLHGWGGTHPPLVPAQPGSRPIEGAA